MAISAQQPVQINDEIRDSELRVIGTDGSQLGIMSSEAALRLADEAGLDLVKIAPNVNPPVCKIMDYGKYRFEQQKKEKESKKNQHTVEIKEVRLSLVIDTHDFETKVGHATRFIQSGNKVKVSIRFRGREMGHPEHGYEIMKRFADALAEISVIEKPAKLEGRNMLMFLAAKPAARPAPKARSKSARADKAAAPAAQEDTVQAEKTAQPESSPAEE